MNNITGIIGKILKDMLVLGLTAFFTPGIKVTGGLIGTLFIAAIVMALISHLLINVLGLGKSKGARGGVSFLVSALIIYLTGKFASGFDVTIIGALIGAFVIGFVDSLFAKH